MSAEYTISSLADFAKVPPDRLGACLADFATWLRLLPKHAEIEAAASRMLGSTTTLVTDAFIWVDDGIAGLSAFTVECEGETIARIDIGPP